MRPANFETLADSHPDANNPHEPYQGVGALFNGDWYNKYPWWAPREDWEIVSQYEIRHYTREELIEMGRYTTEELGDWCSG